MSYPPSPLPPVSGRARPPALVALVALLVVAPLAPPLAHGTDSNRLERRQRPHGGDQESSPSLAAGARFQRIGSRQVLKGGNGMRLSTTAGRWRSGASDLPGARVRVESPWGESLEVDLVVDSTGLLAELNGRIRVLTAFDDDGKPLDLTVTADGKTATTRLANRAELFAAGAPLPPDLDSRAHQALAQALYDELSPAFLAQMTTFDRPPAEVGCVPQLLICIAAISSWVIDVASLPAACLVAGVPTFGVSCALAVIGHELASAAVAYSCGQYAGCRNTENTPPEEPDESTPILIDLAGDGFDLTGLDDPVVFDLTADGRPDRVSWTSPKSDDAFLALDRNGNGRIDDGSELFGTRTPLVDNSYAEHGFIALSEYDLRTTGGNENGSLDRGDAMFHRLVVWNDWNRDGVSSRGELRSLTRAGVVSLGLDYKIDGREDRHGNKFVVNSRAFVRTARGVESRWMSDVYLRLR